MLNEIFLLKCGFEKQDIAHILNIDEKHKKLIKLMAEEYMDTRDLKPFISYTDEELNQSYNRAKAYTDKIEYNLNNDENVDMCKLLFWIYCIIALREDYERLNISEDVFFDTVRDVAYKTAEHKKRYGTLGLDEPWVCLVFDIRLFAFGRLQYQLGYFAEDEYLFDDFCLKKGDEVYACHIPSSGPLTKELCMKSYQDAYAFFKDRLKGSVIPIVTRSYLVYPPYCNSVFTEGSNTYDFIKMFDVIAENETETFGDCWRIFNKDYEGSTEKFPSDTGLQRRFIEYINFGGTFGWGYGVILYDGEKGEIINR